MSGIEFDGQREVFFIGLLDHPWYPDKIHLLGEGKTPDNRGPCQNEDIDVLAEQMGRDGHGPPDMAETIGVMGVHQDVIRGGISFHSTIRSRAP